MTHVNVMGVQREAHARRRDWRELERGGHDTCACDDARATLSPRALSRAFELYRGLHCIEHLSFTSSFFDRNRRLSGE